MTRLMYDSINVDGIPASASIVAGYYYGTYANLTAMRARFPRALIIGITPSANIADGIVDVLDVENGDALPDQAEAWIAAQKAHGYYRPTIYCNLNTVPAVRAGTGKYVLGTDYDLWVAAYDNSVDSVYAGSALKQFESTATWDLSVIYEAAWPLRKAPAPPPAPKPAAPPLAQTGTVLSSTGGTANVLTKNGGYTWFYEPLKSYMGYELEQSGRVHSETTGGSAAVTSIDGGMTWQYGGTATDPKPLDQTGTVTNSTGGKASVITKNGGLTWFYKPLAAYAGNTLHQSGTVHSATTNESAKVTSIDGGMTWQYEG